jgi:hypothetical protein
MPILDRHHRVNKGMGGSRTKEGDWNIRCRRHRDHMDTHNNSKKALRDKIDAQEDLLAALNAMATAGMIEEGGIRLAVGWDGEKHDDEWYRTWKQLGGCGPWPVEDVARVIMGGKLYTPVI